MFAKRVIMGGLPRSGSTLLRSILNAHCAIVAPPETSIFIRPFEEQIARKERLSNKYAKNLEFHTASNTYLRARAQ